VTWARVADTQGINGIAVADDGTTYVSGESAITSWDSSGTKTGSLGHTCNEATIDPNGDLYAVCDYNTLMSFDRGLTVVRWQIEIPSFLGEANDGVVIGKGNTLYVSTNGTAPNGDNIGAVDAFGPL
jgi:hypothetical protein